MAITSNDIKLYQAQDNTDNDSGGGSRTNVEIEDGAVNNLFPDISRIDTVSGDVGLRKVFPVVGTLNNDVYYGAHSMIRKPPTDPKVSSMLFYTDSPHDKRAEAQNKIESYVTASYLEQFWLYGTNIQGARTVQFLANLEAPIPDAGEVYALRENTKEQYIRIVEVEKQEVTLNYNNTAYKRNLLICQIDQPLKDTFNGSAFNPSGQVDGSTDTFATQVSDAAKFYGTKTLSEDITTGDTSLKVDAIFEQLVPATKSQTALVNQDALASGNILVPTGSIKNISLVVGLIPVDTIINLPDAITPKSITKFNYDVTDDGLGNLYYSGRIVATVDYKEANVTWIDGSLNGSINVIYQPANIFESNIQYTGDILINSANQGYVYVKNLSPMPSPMDLYVDYRSQGKWYRISSNGDGTLGNDPTIGAGLLNDNGDGTGTVSLTLGSVPDLESSVIVSWGSSERLTNRKTFIASETQAYLHIDLGKTNIDLTSFAWEIYMPAYSETRFITSDSDGNLVDSGSRVNGRIDPVTGEIFIENSSGSNTFEPVPSANNMIIDFDYAEEGVGDPGEIKSVVFSRTPTGSELAIGSETTATGALSFSIGETVQIDSVRLELTTDYSSALPSAVTLRPIVLVSNNLGELRPVGLSQTEPKWGDVAVNGDVTLSFPTVVSKKYVGVTSNGFFGSTPVYEDVTFYLRLASSVSGNGNDEIITTYKTGNASSYPLSHNITGKLETLAKYVVRTVPNLVGEVGLTFLSTTQNGKYQLFSKNGIVYNNFTNTGIGTNIGEIDYVTGILTIDYFDQPYTMNVDFNKLFSDDIGDSNNTAANISFRTASTKLTAGSLQLRYETANGSYNATSDNAGVITGTDIDSAESRTDPITGMASVVFTTPVIPNSVVYDAVAETSLPLDPELLGLDPVRLPSDGRVPVFANGRHLVIFHENTTTTTNPTPLANDVETLARTGQSYIEVIDKDGKRLANDQYVADRVLGTVTFADPLTLEDKYGDTLTGPFSVVDRIEDMLLATDVQINGLIQLSGALSYDFPKDETKVASSLVWGDIGSRVYNLFTQEIWNNGNPEWSDTLIGDDTTAKYDDINYAIGIDNQSSTSGRWAIIFTSSTTVKVAEEKLGVVQEGISISIDDVAPINPATGNPYFTMLKGGFGAGWVTNNVIRFNTDSGDANMWVVRTVQSGALSEAIDNIELEIRGDAN